MSIVSRYRGRASSYRFGKRTVGRSWRIVKGLRRGSDILQDQKLALDLTNMKASTFESDSGTVGALGEPRLSRSVAGGRIAVSVSIEGGVCACVCEVHLLSRAMSSAPWTLAVSLFAREWAREEFRGGVGWRSGRS